MPIKFELSMTKLVNNIFLLTNTFKNYNKIKISINF